MWIVWVLVGLSVAWIARKWLPSDEKAIRQLISRLAQTASVRSSDSGIARLAYGDRLGAYFTTNVTLHVDGFGAEFANLSGRAELVQAAMAARMQLREAQFRVADLDVQFPESKRKATAYVVMTGEINSQTNAFGQPLRVTLEKSGGRWLISRVDTMPGLH